MYVHCIPFSWWAFAEDRYLRMHKFCNIILESSSSTSQVNLFANRNTIKREASSLSYSSLVANRHRQCVPATDDSTLARCRSFGSSAEPASNELRQFKLDKSSL